MATTGAPKREHVNNNGSEWELKHAASMKEVEAATEVDAPLDRAHHDGVQAKRIIAKDVLEDKHATYDDEYDDAKGEPSSRRNRAGLVAENVAPSRSHEGGTDIARTIKESATSCSAGSILRLKLSGNAPHRLGATNFDTVAGSTSDPAALASASSTNSKLASDGVHAPGRPASVGRAICSETPAAESASIRSPADAAVQRNLSSRRVLADPTLDSRVPTGDSAAGASVLISASTQSSEPGDEDAPESRSTALHGRGERGPLDHPSETSRNRSVAVAPARKSGTSAGFPRSVQIELALARSLETRLTDARASVAALRSSLLAEDPAFPDDKWDPSKAVEAGGIADFGLRGLDDDKADALLNANALDASSVWLQLLPEAELQAREDEAEAALRRERDAAEAAHARREQALAVDAEAAKDDVERRRREAQAEAERAKEDLALATARAQAGLLSAYQRVEAQLRAALARQRAIVRERYGELEAARVGELALPRGLQDASMARQLRVQWEGLPQPVRVHVVCLRGLRGRCPAGRYVMNWELWDRLGGRPLHWAARGLPGGAALAGLGEDRDGPHSVRVLPGTTPLPVRHHGRDSDIELAFQQAAHVALPPRHDLRPGMVVIGRLYRVATRSCPVDAVVGWTVLPACDADCRVVTGMLLLPLLRGDLDPTLASFSQFEACAADRSQWLCNAYVEVSRLPREALVREPRRVTGWGATSGGHDARVSEFDAQLTITGAQLRLRRGKYGNTGASVRERGSSDLHHSNLGIIREPEDVTRWQRFDELTDTDSADDASSRGDSNEGGTETRGGRLASESNTVPLATSMNATQLACDGDADYWRAKASDARRLYAAEASLLSAGHSLPQGTRLDDLIVPSADALARHATHASGPSVFDPAFCVELAGTLALAAAHSTSLDITSASASYSDQLSALIASRARVAASAYSVLPPEERRHYRYDLMGGTSRARVKRKGFRLPVPRALTALTRKMRLLWLELTGDLYPPGATRCARAAAALSSPLCWMQLLLCASAFYARAFAHYTGQYLFLRALRVPVYAFAVAPYGCTLKYVAAALPAHLEIGVVAAGPLASLLSVVAGIGILAVIQAALGGAVLAGPLAPVSWFVSFLGLAAMFDGPLIALVDAAAGRYDCAARYAPCGPDPAGPACPCFQGDAWRLPRRFAADEGSPVMGIAVTAALYVLSSGVGVALLWWYLLNVHLGGRVRDTYSRLCSPHAESLALSSRLKVAADPDTADGADCSGCWLPCDDEVSAEELADALAEARAWRGVRGERMRVSMVQETVTIAEPTAADAAGKSRTGPAETRVHVLISRGTTVDHECSSAASGPDGSAAGPDRLAVTICGSGSLAAASPALPAAASVRRHFVVNPSKGRVGEVYVA